MFLDFLKFMRSHGLVISFSEWMTLMQAMCLNLHNSSLMGFYQLCRCTCIKKEDDLDLFDQCFAAFFHHVDMHVSLSEELMQWLEKPIDILNLSDEEKKQFKELDLEDLKKQFEERLKEQKERHDGGSKWIGTGGRSPFGHSGYHPTGVRVGGQSTNRRAVQIASERRFQNLRHDLVLDTRQIGIALKKLKKLSSDGSRETLDLEGTIKKTAQNAGDIEIVMEKEKKNSIKLLLLMDVGGSMTYHSQISELLFSAAYSSRHFKHFKHFYFHNCPYEFMYSDIEMNEKIDTMDVLRDLDPSWVTIIVGDAAMSPFELTAVGGSVDWYHHNADPGVLWLKRIESHFKKSVWLNPESRINWDIHSNYIIRQVFSMFHLSIDGLEEAIDYLKY